MTSRSKRASDIVRRHGDTCAFVGGAVLLAIYVLFMPDALLLAAGVLLTIVGALGDRFDEFTLGPLSFRRLNARSRVRGHERFGRRPGSSAK